MSTPVNLKHPCIKLEQLLHAVCKTAMHQIRILMHTLAIKFYCNHSLRTVFVKTMYFYTMRCILMINTPPDLYNPNANTSTRIHRIRSLQIFSTHLTM